MRGERVLAVPRRVEGSDLAASWGARALLWGERRAGSLLAMLMLVEAALLLYLGRGISFFFDDWDFVTHDYGGGVHSLLAPHVGNLVFFPIAIYKLLFHLVGLNHYVIFRLVVIALHLSCAGLVFLLARRRLAGLQALLAASLVLFLGAAWEDLLWAFQVGYVLSVAAGLAAWLMLEREDRLGDLAACACLVVAVGSASLGIAMLFGVAVELAWRRQWRRGWIVVLPAALYALWYLANGESQITSASVINAPGFAADLAAAAFGALVGRGLDWGRPLAVLASVVLLVRITRPGVVSARLAGLLATGLALWIITALARSTTSAPETSRYVYLGAVVIVLAAVELVRTVVITPRVTVALTGLVAISAVTGLTVLHGGAAGLRSDSHTLTAELTALELAAPLVSPSYQPDPQLAPQIVAGPYLHAVHAIGSSPAYTAIAVVESDLATRTQVDTALLKFEGGVLAPLRSPVSIPGRRRPLVAGLGGSPPVADGRCWTTTGVVAGAYTEFLLPPGGLIVHAGTAAVQVVLRRFAPPLAGVELGAIAPRAGASIRMPTDDSGRPWFVRVTSASPSEVCGGG